MEKSKSSKETDNILKDLVQTLNTFLNMSTVYFPPFISCVQVRHNGSVYKLVNKTSH